MSSNITSSVPAAASTAPAATPLAVGAPAAAVSDLVPVELSFPVTSDIVSFDLYTNPATRGVLTRWASAELQGPITVDLMITGFSADADVIAANLFAVVYPSAADGAYVEPPADLNELLRTPGAQRAAYTMAGGNRVTFTLPAQCRTNARVPQVLGQNPWISLYCASRGVRYVSGAVTMTFAVSGVIPVRTTVAPF